ncbi:cytochrome D ubiquinol oxidase subunit II [Brasilonema octagenarum UFV-E1]|uniref:Cytochrome D ubiquinol oxidase subunit II n=1 Tax=Brasilonema sennae CENA114 TaxID=415709 RepID=A0A856ML80_9CYAN|nr:LOG family protein [Brasilonema sennae]QDL11302.1 cytochrome D ubiquinol oxidase subunit II [Brasilonema sennae CENA114]QDL17642.1 cytochrome D ubiquinol oxidase subunit II [Brasilonema octagenarum UFV-E1]
MTSSASFDTLESLQADIAKLFEDLPMSKHRQYIIQALATIVRLAHKSEEIERLDWKILSSSLTDMERGFQLFYAYRHVRKVAIFGSARLSPETPEYRMAYEFARDVCRLGFMVMTGGGGGIMQAGNEGAGRENSFGLNIQLPFEQQANPIIEGDPKLIHFKYFFTRKLFLLKESDAIALFPGGFGTQDEAFECMTLSQTGKFGPVPLVLIDHPGGDYWRSWSEYIDKQLVQKGLVSPDDPSLYTVTDNLDVACNAITSFYQVYHSSRYVGDRLLVIRLKAELSDAEVEQLNADFSDILVTGRIEKSQALPQEAQDETFELPRLVLYFNQRDLGRLYQLIAVINRMGTPSAEEKAHPERK